MEAHSASDSQATPSPGGPPSGGGTPTTCGENPPTPGTMPQGLVLPSVPESGQAQMVIPPHSLPAMSIPGMPPGLPHMGGFVNQQQLIQQMLDPLQVQQNGGQQAPSAQPSQPAPVKAEPSGPLPKPPRKPLTPYMRFSKAIWQKVKNANPNMSVCEVGSTIGKMWREMGDAEKQKYNEDFMADKQKYDVELQEYLKVTGLTTADMMKKRDKKKVNDTSYDQTDYVKKRKRNLESSKQPTVAQHLQMRHQMSQVQNSNQQQMQMHPGQGFPPQQQFMMPPGANSTLPHFSQVWAGQNFSPQQAAQMFMMPGLIPNQQQMMASQGEQAQQQLAASMSQAGQMPAQMVVYPSQAQDGSQVLVGTNLPQQGMPAMFQTQEQQATQASTNHSEESTTTPINQAVHSEARAATPQQVASQQQGTERAVSQASNPPGWPWHMVQQQTTTVQPNMDGSPAPPQNQGQQEASTPAHSTPQTATQSQGQPPPNAHTAPPSRVPNGANTPTGQESHPQPNALDMSQSQEGAQASTQENATDDKSSAQFNSAGGTHYLFSAYGPQGPYGQPPPYNGRPVVSKESVMESELQHLRLALSEKTKEVQRLSQELEKAYETMDQMKQERAAFNVQ